MPKKENASRLKKRQKKYLEEFNVYANAQEEDPLYQEKKAVSEAFRALNQKLEELDPYTQDEPVEEEKEKDRKLPGAVSPEDLAALAMLYQKTLERLHELTLHTEEKIDSFKGAQKEAARNAARAHDILAGQLGKDLSAIQKLTEHYEPKPLSEIYEMSRIEAGYTVVKEEKQNVNSGAQNARIPVTLRDQDGKEVHGFFTPDKTAPGDEKLLTLVENIKAKYGPAADFFDADLIFTLYEKYRKQNSLIIDTIHDKKEELSFMPHRRAVEELTAGTSGKPDIAALINTPEKLKIYVDIMHAGFRMINEMDINQTVGIESGRNVNRRNAAMSAIAKLLGCDDVVAESENLKIELDGMEVKGTFMKEVSGTDTNKLTPKSKLFKLGPDSVDGLELKKKIADLQVVDFLCGNPDRHRGNMIYDITEPEEDKAEVASFKGIDNDSCLGTNSFDKVKGMSAVQPEQMKVMTHEMAERILSLTPGKMRTMLYGFKLSAKEVAGAEKRLVALQKKIVADQEKYAEGYTKGYLIPGTIKIVDDKELSELSLSQDLCGKDRESNCFNRVGSLTRHKRDIEKLSEKTQKQYMKTLYDATIGCMGNVSRLVGELEEDYKGGGSSSKYNKMMKEMKNLKKALAGMTGTMIGVGADTSKGHVAAVTKIREQMTKALEAAKEYQEYKKQKQTGEEWMQNPGEGEVTRQERRYHHGTDVKNLMTAQLKVFEELDKKLEACRDVKRKKNILSENAEKRQEEYAESAQALQKKKTRDRNLYRNHLSRIMYQIKGIAQAVEKAQPQDVKAQELLFDAAVAFALLGTKTTDREKMKQDIEETTGRKLQGSDDDLIRRGVASHLVLSAKGVRSIKEADQSAGEMQMYDATKDMDLTDLSKAVENLAEKQVFKNFCKHNRNLLVPKDVLYTPEIPLPSPEKTADIFEDYNMMADFNAVSKKAGRKRTVKMGKK